MRSDIQSDVLFPPVSDIGNCPGPENECGTNHLLRLVGAANRHPMSRRSQSRFKIDDKAYPVRVKVIVPDGGMQLISGRVSAWLTAELDKLAWSWGPAPATGCGQVTAYHFRRLEDAQRFTTAFPELVLADDVDALAHRVGGDRTGDRSFSAGPGRRDRD
jgi:hypothetical protein